MDLISPWLMIPPSAAYLMLCLGREENKRRKIKRKSICFLWEMKTILYKFTFFKKWKGVENNLLYNFTPNCRESERKVCVPKPSLIMCTKTIELKLNIFPQFFFFVFLSPSSIQNRENNSLYFHFHFLPYFTFWFPFLPFSPPNTV